MRDARTDLATGSAPAGAASGPAARRVRLRLRVHLQWLAWVFFLPFVRLHPLLQGEAWSRDLAAIVCLGIGLFIRAWSAGHLDKGNRGVSLTTSGPYRYVRHPLYVGSLFLAIGVALLSGAHPIAAAGVVLVFFGTHVYTLFREERLMAERFGESHTAWRARTGLLWPGRGSGNPARWRLRLYLQNGEYWAGLAGLGGLAALFLGDTVLRWLR